MGKYRLIFLSFFHRQNAVFLDRQNGCFLKKILRIFRFHAEFRRDFKSGVTKCVDNYGNVPGIVPGKVIKIA